MRFPSVLKLKRKSQDIFITPYSQRPSPRIDEGFKGNRRSYDYPFLAYWHIDFCTRLARSSSEWISLYAAPKCKCHRAETKTLFRVIRGNSRILSCVFAG
eukprot:scaffold287743_cov33-Prasinocladus_malaysianus.AAC.1